MDVYCFSRKRLPYAAGEALLRCRSGPATVRATWSTSWDGLQGGVGRRGPQEPHGVAAIGSTASWDVLGTE